MGRDTDGLVDGEVGVIEDGALPDRGRTRPESLIPLLRRTRRHAPVSRETGRVPRQTTKGGGTRGPTRPPSLRFLSGRIPHSFVLHFGTRCRSRTGTTTTTRSSPSTPVARSS